MSHPKTKIDWDYVDKLLQAGCKGTEVAANYGIHPDTFYRLCQEQFNMGFSDYLHQKRACGDAVLRLAQYDLAISGDRVMLIWLGKQRLEQRDVKELAISPDDITAALNKVAAAMELRDLESEH